MLDQTFWAKYFKEYDVLNHLIPYQELLETLCNELDVQEGDYILDAGSGTGNLAMKLEERGAHVVALDFSEEGQKRHKSKAPKQTEFVLGDLTESLPFPDNHFDKIVSNNTIYALSRAHKFFIYEEFFRVSRPRGKIVISNVHVGFSPFVIYKAHIRSSFKKHGVLMTLKNILKLSISTMKIFYYNKKIKHEHKSGDFWFIRKGEQHQGLALAGFKNISEEKLGYAKQAIMNSGEK